MQKNPAERKDKLKHVALADVVIGERFRVDFGDVEAMVESIREKGIIQPISIDENYNLLAGGRRVHCAAILELKTIPAIIRPFVDEIDSRELELMENVYRKDFTWQERAALTKEINELYKKNNREWSARKTAELTDRSKTAVARDIEIATAMEFFPELRDASTADDAHKMIKQIEAQAIMTELRTRQKDNIEKNLKAPTHGTDYNEHGNRIERDLAQFLRIADSNYRIEDVFTGLAAWPSNGMVGFIECDPPYGIDLVGQKGSKDSVTSTVHGYEEVPADDYPNFISKLTKELYRVAGRDCWLVFWYGPTWHQFIYQSLLDAGWSVDVIPAIWVKPTGQTLQPEVNLARSYEPFFVCRKGKPVLANRGRRNVFEYAGVATSGVNAKIHPTERPVPLIEEVLNTFHIGMHTVLVPFAGSGNTLRACYNLGMRVMGYDLNGQYKDKFMLRVEEDARKNLANDQKE